MCATERLFIFSPSPHRIKSFDMLGGMVQPFTPHACKALVNIHIFSEASSKTRTSPNGSSTSSTVTS